MIKHRGLSRILGWLKRGVCYHLWLYLTAKGRTELFFDRLHGVATDGIVPISEGDRFPDGGFYEPSRPSMFLQLISRLQIDHSRFTFMDIGTGKGRPLLLALRFKLTQALGKW